jgi:D-sedoheptulose 7-phosphate isomerase
LARTTQRDEGDVIDVQLEAELAQHIAAVQETVRNSSSEISDVVDRICSCLAARKKLLLCGNGGSAADAQHIAAEFINRLRLDRRPLPALALTTDTSILTCISNDSAFEEVFARQVDALGQDGDMLIGLSTSGRSPNVLAALETGRAAGLTTAGFTGHNGREHMQGVCDVVIAVASSDCPRIQEVHAFLWHVIAGEVEARLFGS